MADLIVLGFDNEDTAEAVRTLTGKLMKEHLIELGDAVVVVRTQDGKVKIHQAFNPAAAGAASGALWGTFVGLLFLNPLLGAALGAGAGALSGSLIDVGINDDTIREIGQTLQPGTSALFLLLKQATFDKLSEALRPYNPKVIRTSLSYASEAELVRALAGQLDESKTRTPSAAAASQT
jgi:uncharacterized membrane protein